MLDKEPLTLGNIGLNRETYNKIHERLKAIGWDGGVCFFPTKYKDRFECLISTFTYMLQDSDAGKKIDVDEELWHEMKTLAQSLVYLTNSTSYRKGSYFDFDRFEIDKKLGRKLK